MSQCTMASQPRKTFTGDLCNGHTIRVAVWATGATLVYRHFRHTKHAHAFRAEVVRAGFNGRVETWNVKECLWIG